MKKFNGIEQITAADRNAGGYDPGTGSVAEMNRALNAFLDDRGLVRSYRPAFGRKAKLRPSGASTPERPASTASAPEPAISADAGSAAPTPLDPPEQTRAPPPAPEPVVVATPAEELVRSAAALRSALLDYAFCKACLEGADSPEIVTEHAEKILLNLNLPEDLISLVELLQSEPTPESSHADQHPFNLSDCVARIDAAHPCPRTGRTSRCAPPTAPLQALPELCASRQPRTRRARFTHRSHPLESQHLSHDPRLHQLDRRVPQR